MLRSQFAHSPSPFRLVLRYVPEFLTTDRLANVCAQELKDLLSDRNVLLPNPISDVPAVGRFPVWCVREENIIVRIH